MLVFRAEGTILVFRELIRESPHIDVVLHHLAAVRAVLTHGGVVAFE